MCKGVSFKQIRPAFRSQTTAKKEDGNIEKCKAFILQTNSKKEQMNVYEILSIHNTNYHKQRTGEHTEILSIHNANYHKQRTWGFTKRKAFRRHRGTNKNVSHTSRNGQNNSPYR